LLAQIRLNFPDRCAIGPLSPALHQWCEQLRGKGVFNMLLSNGYYLFAYCSTKLSWITREAPFGEAALSDVEMTVDFKEETTPHDVVTVIATQPLTDNEAWTPLKPGELVVFKEGEIVERYASRMPTAEG